MASWVVYAFVLYLYIVGSSLYKLFYPAQCPYGPTDARCVHPLLPTGALSRCHGAAHAVADTRKLSQARRLTCTRSPRRTRGGATRSLWRARLARAAASSQRTASGASLLPALPGRSDTSPMRAQPR
jgi:hypothetical protein